MKSGVRAWRIGRVLLRYRLDEFLDDTPAQRWLRLARPFVPRASRAVAALPRGERLRLALQELGPIFVKFGQILSTRRSTSGRWPSRCWRRSWRSATARSG